MHIPRLLSVVLAIVVLPLSSSAFAVPGDLDPSFGGDGKVTTSVPDGNVFSAAISMQTDGKIVVAGTLIDSTKSHFAALRYLADGSPDATFNQTGMAVTDVGFGNDGATCLALQSDGKILLGGYRRNSGADNGAVVRYLADGALDETFGNAGKVTLGDGVDEVTGIAVQGDGGIVLVGNIYNGVNSDLSVCRLRTDGSLDFTFHGTGKVTMPIGNGDDFLFSVVLQNDGKIVLAGTTVLPDAHYGFGLARLNGDGSRDGGFNFLGTVATSFSGANGFAYALTIQPDGKLLVAGAIGGVFGLARYQGNGELDRTFGNRGWIVTGVGGAYSGASSVAVQGDQKIVAAGYRSVFANDDFTLIRYLPNGSLDPSFNGSGMVVTDIAGSNDRGVAVGLQNDGKIVVTGYYTEAGSYGIATARYERGPPSPIEEWKFSELQNVNASDVGDPDHDGLLTLVEYGLRLSPKTPSLPPGASVSTYTEGERLRIFMPRDPAHNDIIVSVEATGDVMAGPWEAVATSTFGAPFTGPGYVGGDGSTPGVKTVEVRDTVNTSTKTQRWLRVKVTH